MNIKKLLIPALILPMTAQTQAFSFFGVDVAAINKCNAEVYERMEIDEETQVTTIHLTNGSTMSSDPKTGEMIIDGEFPKTSKECEKVYAEMEDSPFVKMLGDADSQTDGIEIKSIEKDGDRTIVQYEDTREKEEEEEMTSEEKLDLVDKATEVTDSVLSKIGKWFD